MFSEDKTFVICELSQTHEGSREIAETLVKAAADAKADAVKVQVFEADELAIPSYQHYALFKKLEWPASDWKALIDSAHAKGLKVFADIFGLASAKMLLKIGIDGIKVHATDMRNPPLLKFLADVRLPLFLSIGGGSVKEVGEALKYVKVKSRKAPTVLMHGFQAYPTLVEETNLLKMKFFKEHFKLPVGFADHIDGDHRQNFSLCAMAVGMGASIIEKHITLNRDLKMEDYESALNPEGFVEFVAKIRELDTAKGAYSDKLYPSEVNYRKVTRKHVAVTQPIKKGEVIRDAKVALKRVPADFDPVFLNDVLGRVSKRNIQVHEAIGPKDFERKSK